MPYIDQMLISTGLSHVENPLHLIRLQNTLQSLQNLQKITSLLWTDYIPIGPRPSTSALILDPNPGHASATTTSTYIATTGWAKKRGHRLMTIILSNLNRFIKIFH